MDLRIRQEHRDPRLLPFVSEEIRLTFAGSARFGGKFRAPTGFRKRRNRVSVAQTGNGCEACEQFALLACDYALLSSQARHRSGLKGRIEPRYRERSHVLDGSVCIAHFSHLTSSRPDRNSQSVADRMTWTSLELVLLRPPIDTVINRHREI